MEAESSRDESIVQEANLSRIRNLINQNKIKLWLDPYYDNDNKTPFETKMLQTANALAPGNRFQWLPNNQPLILSTQLYVS